MMSHRFFPELCSPSAGEQSALCTRSHSGTLWCDHKDLGEKKGKKENAFHKINSHTGGHLYIAELKIQQSLPMYSAAILASKSVSKPSRLTAAARLFFLETLTSRTFPSE